MKSLQAVTTFFNRFFLINFCILCIGVPLLFSSATRSVFEVNKLLIIRLVLLVVYGVWIYRSLLFKDNGIQAAEQDCYSVFGFRFRRVGLEMALLLWMICNLVSIILSPNIYLSYIGAYDRWEGLMTIFNYVLLVYMVAKLIDNTRYRIALFCFLLFATCVSSVYGVIQSLGLDFMNWSADPVSRVFACINNPVHFCAYVGMIVPVGLSLSQYFLHRLSSTTNDGVLFSLKRYMGWFFGSMIVFFLLAFRSVSVGFIQFLVLSGIAAVIFREFQTLIPSKKTALQLAGFFLGVSGLYMAGLLAFTALQLTCFLFVLALLFCLSVVHHRTLFLYRLCLMTTLVVFYSMFLSFSRATIIGFVISMGFFYQLIFEKKLRDFSPIMCFLLLIGISLLDIGLIFKVHVFGQLGILVQCLFSGLGFCSFYWVAFPTLSWRSLLKHRSLAPSLALFLVYVFPFFDLAFLKPYLLIYALFVCFSAWVLVPRVSLVFFKNISCTVLLLNLCFYFSSLAECVLFFTFLAVFALFYLRSQASANERFHFVSTLVLMGCLVSLPLLVLFSENLFIVFTQLLTPVYLLNAVALFTLLLVLGILVKRSWLKPAAAVCGVLLFMTILGSGLFSSALIERHQSSSASDSLAVASNIKNRMKNVSSNKARLYMWLSVPGWLLDYPLFGSGPDTIRFLYPEYRHPKYGIHEGGHNFTPDRLHNEYLNTLACNGIIGFVVKYVLLFGGWYWILFQLLRRHRNDPKQYVLIGIICGPSIYLIQTLFNFGVVATLFLFYFLLGLGLSFVNDEYHEPSQIA